MAMLCTSVSLLIRHQRLTLMLPNHTQLVLALLLYLVHHLRRLGHHHLFQIAEIVSNSKHQVYLLVLSFKCCHMFTANPMYVTIMFVNMILKAVRTSAQQ